MDHVDWAVYRRARRLLGELEILDPRLKEIVDRLVAAYRPERVYLFGSHARGEPGPDSDFDLLVLVPDEPNPSGGEADWPTRHCGARGSPPTSWCGPRDTSSEGATCLHLFRPPWPERASSFMSPEVQAAL